MSNDEQHEDIELGVVAGGEDKDLHPSQCSFCGRNAADVNCLLEGSGALICDACVARYKAQLQSEI